MKITKNDAQRILAEGVETFEGRCMCEIHENKPGFCKLGPVPESRLSGCGYTFHERDGVLVRSGDCLRCGQCCSIPRKNGSPWGTYDPRGTACKYLKVSEVRNEKADMEYRLLFEQMAR